VTSVQYHSNGTQALTAGKDKTAKLWDLASGKAARTFGPLADAISLATFNRDFTLVGVAAGKTVKVWNAADGKDVATLAAPAEVLSLSFSVDKAKLAAGGADGVTRVWDLASGKELEAFRQAGPVRSVVFHPNNTSVLAGSADKSTAVHTLSVTRQVAASAGPVRRLAVIPAGTHLLTASDDKAVKLWNIANGVNERTFIGADGPVHALAVSKNGALVAVGGADKAVRLFNFADGKPISVFTAPGTVLGLAFSPNNATLAATCDDKSLVTWNVVFNPGQPTPADFGKVGQTYTHTQAATDVTFAADNVTLFSSGVDKMVKAWRFAADAPTRNFAHPNFVDAVAFHPTSPLLATGCHDGTVRIWDLAKNAQVRQINAHTTPTPPAPVYGVAWSPDGKQLVSSSFDKTLKLWDAASGNVVREFKAYKPAEPAVTNRETVATAAGALAYLVPDKPPENGHRDSVFSVAFSPDGKFLVSGGSDRTIKVWNVADSKVVREFINPNLKTATAPNVLPPPPAAHPGWVYALRFTADGKHLVSAGNAPRNQGHLAVWSFADGKLLHSEDLALGPIYSVAISPDGKRLALGCGPRGRQFQDVPAYLLKMPDAVK
jgi:WD40 repeat protein